MAGRAKPIVEMLIPRRWKSDACARSKHVASLFLPKHVAPQLPAGFPGGSGLGRTTRRLSADLMIGTVDRHMHRVLPISVGLAVRCSRPLDLERKLSLVGGEYLPRQTQSSTSCFPARAGAGYGDYRATAQGAFKCAALDPSRRRCHRCARPTIAAREIPQRHKGPGAF